MRIHKIMQPILICIFVFPLFFTSIAVKAEDNLETLLQVDRDFAASATKNGVKKAFAEFLAKDGIVLSDGQQPKIGYEAIMSTFVEEPNSSVTWVPKGGDISGDLGYTWGVFTDTITADDGSKSYEYGKYVTAWKRQADGSWKVALDMGNTNPKPE